MPGEGDIWVALYGILAAIFGAPTSVKIVAWVRRLLSLDALVGRPAKDNSDGTPATKATGLHATDKELRDLIDIQADQIAMLEMRIFGLIEAQDLPVFVLDLKGNTLFISPFLSKQLGAVDTLNGDWQDAIQSDDRVVFDRTWAEYIANVRKRTAVFKFRWRAPDGQTRRMRLKLVRKFIDETNGSITGYMTEDLVATPEPSKQAKTPTET